MDTQNIDRASDYINNLLLSRGLVRNNARISFLPSSPPRPRKTFSKATSKSIQEQSPAADKHNNVNSNSNNTAAAAAAAAIQTINLIHSLILSHDALTTRLDHLSSTLQTQRTTNAQSTGRIAALEAQNQSLTRLLALAQASERNKDLEKRKVEREVRRLREEVVRNRGAVGKVRTMCALDVRRRDLELGRLRGVLGGLLRGGGGRRRDLSGAASSTSSSSMRIVHGTRPGGMVVDGGAARKEEEWAREVEPGVDDEDYTLERETNAFLTELSRGLSDENEGLIRLVREVMAQLRDMQGLSPVVGETITAADDVVAGGCGEGNFSSEERLAEEMNNVLDQLRGLLTNPSFVPIEEVVARDEEIVRLREAWETMEERWKEAVGMMDGWKKKMAKGEELRIEELKMDLGLGGLGLGDSSHAQAPESRLDEEQGVVDEEESQSSLGNISNESADEQHSPSSHQQQDTTEESEAKPTTTTIDNKNNKNKLRPTTSTKRKVSFRLSLPPSQASPSPSETLNPPIIQPASPPPQRQKTSPTLAPISANPRPKTRSSHTIPSASPPLAYSDSSSPSSLTLASNISTPTPHFSKPRASKALIAIRKDSNPATTTCKAVRSFLPPRLFVMFLPSAFLPFALIIQTNTLYKIKQKQKQKQKPKTINSAHKTNLKTTIMIGQKLARANKEAEEAEEKENEDLKINNNKDKDDNKDKSDEKDKRAGRRKEKRKSTTIDSEELEVLICGSLQ